MNNLQLAKGFVKLICEGLDNHKDSLMNYYESISPLISMKGIVMYNFTYFIVISKRGHIGENPIFLFHISIQMISSLFR